LGFGKEMIAGSGEAGEVEIGVRRFTGRKGQRRREIPHCAGRPLCRSKAGRKNVGLLRSE
jgi:hypothetical protein